MMEMDLNRIPAQQSTVGSASRNFEVNLMSKDFKLPQVFRVNLATDVKLPGDINATFEAMYSKTINNVLYQDINLTDPVGMVDPAYNNGADRRIAFASSTAARQKESQSSPMRSWFQTPIKVMLIILRRSSAKHGKMYLLHCAYNHNDAADVNSGANSTALSNWEFVQVVGDPNNPPLSTSNYALTHRFTGIVSVNLNYTKYLKNLYRVILFR